MSAEAGTTINFFDPDSSQAAVAIVRSVGENVALCLSLQHDGDVEVSFPAGECGDLIRALQDALKAACAANAGS